MHRGAVPVRKCLVEKGCQSRNRAGWRKKRKKRRNGSDESAVEKHSWSGPAFAKAAARQEGLEQDRKTRKKDFTEAREGNEEGFEPCKAEKSLKALFGFSRFY